jgi:glucose-6-phosphate isomerase
MSLRLVSRSLRTDGPINAFPKDAKARVARAVERLSSRGHERYGFLDAGREVSKEIQRIAQELREGTDDVLVLGIGGSALGTTAFMNATNAERRAHVHVLESPDPVHLREVLAKLEPKRTAVNIVSKSGTTL